MAKKKLPEGVYLIGIGIKGLDHLTRETDRVLAGCRIIYGLTDQHRLLSQRYKNVVDLDRVYWKSKSFHGFYEKLVRRVIKDALKGGCVGVVTYGHPLFYDDVSLGLLKTTKRKGIPCRVLPAISCFDTICIDLNIDFGDGIQIHDAERVCMDKTVINPEIDTLLMQIGTFGVDAPNEVESSRKRRLRPLVRYLKKFYKPNQRATIVFSEDGDLKSVKRKTTISNLERDHKFLFPGSTLYIPGQGR